MEPSYPSKILRTYLRQRDELVGARSTHCQHLQKALLQMNVQLPQLLSDITGVSGLAIFDAILQGERDPAQLAARVDRCVRATAASCGRMASAQRIHPPNFSAPWKRLEPGVKFWRKRRPGATVLLCAKRTSILAEPSLRLEGHTSQ